jgi:hypothetical protein
MFRRGWQTTARELEAAREKIISGPRCSSDKTNNKAFYQLLLVHRPIVYYK